MTAALALLALDTPGGYGWLSLLPPLVAIGLAIAFKRVLIALLTGVFVGALILAGWNPFTAVVDTIVMIVNAITDVGHLQVLAFTLLMGAMVGLISRSGGMQGLVDLLLPLARTRRGAQLTGWLAGLVIFFDDYANTVLLGHTWRPVTDRLKISRAKLAYLVDSTAAPVAGLAPISTWVATEVEYIAQGLKEVDLPADAYTLFLQTIPYRFYVLWALAWVVMIGWLNRDFGPMATAEDQAALGQDPSALLGKRLHVETTDEPHKARWYNAVVPIAAVVLVVLGTLWYTGSQGLAADPDLPPTLWNVLGKADSYVALLYGSIAGVLAAVLLVAVQRLLSVKETCRGLFAGGLAIAPGLLVLILAWSLSAITGSEPGQLQTGTYLASLLSAGVPTWLLPTLVFALAGGTAFATGTSWGTLAILMPLAIQVAAGLLRQSGPLAAEDPILLATIGSVLAGSIFGDHCSPISDTTVLSSQASGCDHLEHVRTQMPYALCVGVISILFGTLPAGFGISGIWLLPLGLVVMLGVLLLLGRKFSTSDPTSKG